MYLNFMQSMLNFELQESIVSLLVRDVIVGFFFFFFWVTFSLSDLVARLINTEL